MTKNKESSSFRDPAGYIYYCENKIYRKINKCYLKQYTYCKNEGLYDDLIKQKYLIKHQEIEKDENTSLLEVEKVPFISYPYEWCFEQLKEAALLTIKINKIALQYGMILKDASCYNVQFIGCNPIFIDTLSFDFYKEGTPWGAYGQFCRHFMAPLLLMAHIDENLNCLLKNYIDGIPLDVASHILGHRGGLTAMQHIKWQNQAISKHNNDGKKNIHTEVKIKKESLINMLDMIIRQIEKLSPKKTISEWEDYYNNTNYTLKQEELKSQIITKYLSKIKLNSDDITFDLGANNGKYSRIISQNNSYVVAFDIDTNAVKQNYQECKEKNEKILPLVLDLNNPSPSIGFAYKERKNLNERTPVKLVLSLALIHHIAISNNVPLNDIANWFSQLGKYLIIEFVPKEDSQVKILLKTRTDIFDKYDEENFEKEFTKYYTIIEKDKIKNSQRTLYLMEKKDE